MSTQSKPYQTGASSLLMIREGFLNALADATQGPLLITALKAALDLSTKIVEIASTSPNLDDAHDGATVELLTDNTTVTLRAQADYAWPDVPTMITLRSEFAFSLATGAGVEVNGEIAETWNCEAWPAAIVLHRRAEDVWGLTGGATVAP
jgi:hypothetical protein